MEGRSGHSRARGARAGGQPAVQKLRVHSAFEHPAVNYAPPRSLKAIKGLMGLAAFLAFLAIAYVLFWYISASDLRSTAEDWIQEVVENGEDVTFREMTLSGFPYDIRLEVREPKWQTTRFDKPLSWRADRVSVSTKPWSLGTYTFGTSGAHDVVWGEGDAAQTYKGFVAKLALTYDHDKMWPVMVDALVEGLEGKRKNDGQSFGIGNLVAHLDYLKPSENTPVTPAYRLSADISTMTFPGQMHLPLGDTLQKLRLDAEVLVDIPRKTFKPSLEKWRDAGGTVEFYELNVDYGPLRMVSDGTLALDGALQPVGSFSTHLEGFFETINALRRIGLMRSRDAIAAKLVLGVLSKRPPGGGKPVLNAPVTLQERTLYVGPIVVTEVPGIVWPEPVEPKAGDETEGAGTQDTEGNGRNGAPAPQKEGTSLFSF